MSSQTLPAPAKQLFSDLFEQASLGIAVENLDGKILLANPALCSMLGYTEEELCAMNCSQFADPEDAEDDWAHFQQLRTGIIDHYSLEKRYLRKDGIQIWGSLNVSISKNTEDGSPLVFAFVEEITDRKLADQELVQTNQQLRFALETSKSVSWEWDVKSGRTSRFGDLQNMYGIDGNKFVGHVDEFLRHVHPEDRQMVEKTIADARQSRKPYASEFRIVRADGAVRWMFARGTFHYGKEGDAERMLGIATDITERKQTEERLREYEKAVEGSEEIIAVIDRDYRYLIANRKFLNLRKMTKEQVVGHLVSEVLDKEIFESILKEKMDQCFAGRVVTFELRYPYPEIGQRDLLVSYFPIEGATGVDRVVCVLQDITERKKSSEALRSSEERFRLAAQAGNMYAFDWDVATDRVIRSDEYANILGFTDETVPLTRQQVLTTVHPDDRAMFGDAAYHLTPESPHSQMCYRVVRPDGSTVWLEKRRRAFFDERGTMVRVIGIVADITERKQSEEALKRSEANYRLFVSQSSEGIFCEELDRPIPIDLPEDEQVQRILHESYMAECNEAMAKMYGFSADVFVGKRLTDTLDVGNPANIELTRDYIRSGYRIVDRESHEVDAQGNPKVFLNSMIGIVENGMLLRTWGIQRDVTARVQAEKARALSEQALRESEQRFRLAAQAGKMFAYEWDATSDVILRSPEAVQILGIDEAAHVTGQEILAKVHPDDREILLAAMAALSPEKPDLQICYRMIRPDGTVIWVDRNSRAHFSEQGTLLRIVGMVVDITDRKLAAEALKKSEEKFSKAFRQSPMALTLTRARDHRYIDVNETFERITGWQRNEIIGRTSVDIEVWADASEMVQITNRLMAEQRLRNLELRFRMRDGSVRTGLSSAELIELEGEPCILGVTADITDYKRAQEALRESEDKLRLLLDSTAEAIYGVDLEHRCTFCNPACLRTLGYERLDEVLGKNMHDLMHHSRADGTLFPVNECRVHRVTQTGEGVHAEDEVFRRANGTNFPAEYWAYPQRKGHELVGAVVAFVDITQRKLAEAAVADVSRRLIEVQEQERARIARELHDDIGQRLSMLAIEIEELQQNSNDLPAPVHSRLHEFWQQTCEIANDIQSLSHELHSAKLEYLGIVAAMRGFCNDFGRQQNLQIEFEAKDLVSFPPADASLCLLRVLQEALHNSAKHSGVRRHHVRLWENEKEVHLTVSDAGAGFDREAVKQNPTGLGLISMEERLKLVNGALTIESQPKSGTTIHATVPLRSDATLLRPTG